MSVSFQTNHGYFKLCKFYRREDEEEGVSSYWMTLRKREDTGN
jgi:hypothetical protein